MATILCVDDEPQLRQLLVLELADAGYETLEAGDGRAALQLIVDKRPDLVLSDVTMPMMNGYELVQELRTEHPDCADVPFILLSALVDRKDAVAGIELGADDYLTKPIDIDLLLERVAAKLAD